MNVYLPLVGAKPPTVRTGYALYDVPHQTYLDVLADGIAMQNWNVADCFLDYPAFYPTLHSTLWWHQRNAIARMAEKYPKRTWLLLNEPDMPPPQAHIRPEYALGIIKEWITLLKPYSHSIAGYGITVTQPTHWTNTVTSAWSVIGWRRWLDGWNKIKGPTPNKAHIHVYAKTVQDWQDQYSAWRDWNQANWQVPTLITEYGEGQAIIDYVTNQFYDSNIEVALHFTNLKDNPIHGLPDSPTVVNRKPGPNLAYHVLERTQ